MTHSEQTWQISEDEPLKWLIYLFINDGLFKEAESYLDSMEQNYFADVDRTNYIAHLNQYIDGVPYDSVDFKTIMLNNLADHTETVISIIETTISKGTNNGKQVEPYIKSLKDKLQIIVNRAISYQDKFPDVAKFPQRVLEYVEAVYLGEEYRERSTEEVFEMFFGYFKKNDEFGKQIMPSSQYEKFKSELISLVSINMEIAPSQKYYTSIDNRILTHTYSSFLRHFYGNKKPDYAVKYLGQAFPQLSGIADLHGFLSKKPPLNKIPKYVPELLKKAAIHDHKRKK